MKLWPLRPATRAGQKAMAIQMMIPMSPMTEPRCCGCEHDSFFRGWRDRVPGGAAGGAEWVAFSRSGSTAGAAVVPAVPSRGRRGGRVAG